MSGSNFVQIQIKICPTPRTSSSRIKWIFISMKGIKSYVIAIQQLIKMKFRGKLISNRARSYYPNRKLNIWHGYNYINEYI